MIVRIITVKVKRDQVEEFKRATVRNHLGSVAEPGVLRFDVLQDPADPTRFVLYEAYKSEEATATHKTTDHYNAWKSEVESMMDGPRESMALTPIAPLSEADW